MTGSIAICIAFRFVHGKTRAQEPIRQES
jgi:hypothetical protein